MTYVAVPKKISARRAFVISHTLIAKPAVNTTPIPSFMTAGLSNFDDINASLSTASSSGNH